MHNNGLRNGLFLEPKRKNLPLLVLHLQRSRMEGVKILRDEAENSIIYFIIAILYKYFC